MPSPYQNPNYGSPSHVGSEKQPVQGSLQQRLRVRGIASLSEEIGRHDSANTRKAPIKFTERAKMLGASVVSAAALGGVLWAGLHANAEANKDHVDPANGVGQVHNPEQQVNLDIAKTPGEELRDMLDKDDG